MNSKHFVSPNSEKSQMNMCLCVTDKGKDGHKVIEMEGYLEIHISHKM